MRQSEAQTSPAFGPDGSSGAGGEAAVPRTRSSSLWVFAALGVTLLAVVLVFILENLQDATVSFFGARWRVPLGVDLLLATTLGALLVLVIGAVRVLQLRHLAHRRHHALRRMAEHQAADSAAQPVREEDEPA